MSKLAPAEASVINPRRAPIAAITHRFRYIYFHFKALIPPDAVGLVTLLVPRKVRPQGAYLHQNARRSARDDLRTAL